MRFTGIDYIIVNTGRETSNDLLNTFLLSSFKGHVFENQLAKFRSSDIQNVDD